MSSYFAHAKRLRSIWASRKSLSVETKLKEYRGYSLTGGQERKFQQLGSHEFHRVGKGPVVIEKAFSAGLADGWLSCAAVGATSRTAFVSSDKDALRLFHRAVGIKGATSRHTLFFLS